MRERIEGDNQERHATHAHDLDHCRDHIRRSGVDAEAVISEVARFSAAVPSWALGAGGTRFGRFPVGGEPRNTEEKIDDAAALNALTGANRTVSLHVPWDAPADPVGLRAYAEARGLAFDAMNSNTFQDNPSTTRDGTVSYKFGSLAHTDPAVRDAAVEHNRHCIELGLALGSKALSVWLADGTSYPGQASFRGQYERALEGLRQIHSSLPAGWHLLVEHKPYEPAFYSSVNSDWGSSLLLAQGTGDRTLCLVDLGHHLPTANLEQVISRLAMVARLGGIHFNDSQYGDDDLTAGSMQPYRLFLIFVELLHAGGGRAPSLAYTIDQSHNLKDPLEDLLQATEAIQYALAQALCVDRVALAAAQETNDPVMAAEILNGAFRSDVRPLVAEARRRAGAALAPVAVYRAAGYREVKTAERGRHSISTGL